MAFDFETLSHVGGSSPAPRIYTYETEDDRVTVLGADYFNEVHTKFQVKDLIIVNNTVEVYTAKVTAVAKNLVTVEKTSFLDREYAYYYLSQDTALTLNDDGVTYTKVPNMIAPIVRDFTITDGTLKYHGVGGLFSFVGSVDMSSQKNADIHISLFINGVASEQSVVRSFTSANKRGSTTSNGIFQINTNDEFEVRMKGDGTTNLTVDIFGTNLTFLEV